jgi:putative endonuclease
LSTRAVGAWAERVACVFLESQGYEIVKRNFYTRFGEIDIIAKDENYLVFIEVKYRKSKEYGFPSQAVTYKKQQRIRRSCEFYLIRYGIKEETPIRFDVVEIIGKKIRVIKNAF